MEYKFVIEHTAVTFLAGVAAFGAQGYEPVGGPYYDGYHHCLLLVRKAKA